MEYQVKETVVLGEAVTLYSADGWCWFSDLAQLHKWEKKHAEFDGDFNWKATHRRRVAKKKGDEDF
jgi:hypothetical protein